MIRFPRRGWLTGRIDPEEIVASREAMIVPRYPERPAPGALIVLGRSRRQRPDELPLPPRRERPPDLDATAAGVELYGPRRHTDAATPRLLLSTFATLEVATRFRYVVPQGVRGARLVSLVWTQDASGGASATLRLSIVRGDTNHVIFSSSLSQYPGTQTSLTPLMLEPGDELRCEVINVSTGATPTATLAVGVEEVW